MALMTFRRQKIHYHVDGSKTVEYIEQTVSWPMMTCLTFKRDFPDAFVSVEHEYAEPDRKAKRKTKSNAGYHKTRSPDVEAALEPKITSTTDVINEEVKKAL